MDWTVTVQIMAVLFWVISALALVCGIILTFVQFEYYRWERDQREKAEFEENVKRVLDENNC